MVRKRIPKKVEGAVKDYVKRLEEGKLPIEKVIIYGSQVKGTAHKWSDIDVCIISPKFSNSIEAIRFLLLKRRENDVKAGIEAVGFTKQDFEEGGSLIQEIKRTGVVII